MLRPSRICYLTYIVYVFRTTLCVTIFWVHSDEEEDFNFSTPSVQDDTYALCISLFLVGM